MPLDLVPYPAASGSYGGSSVSAPEVGENMQRVTLGGVEVDLLEFDDAIARITARATSGDADPGASRDRRPSGRPMAVISANLDHVAQFGTDGRWYGTLTYSLGHEDGDGLSEDAGSSGESSDALPDISADAGWLTLLDGAPLVAEANRLTGKTWPRLAGSDLIGPLLDAAEAEGITVGFLGGSRLIQRLLSRRLTRTRPNLLVSGMWSPDRSVLADDAASRQLAAAIAASGTRLLVVGLGKPRQELWIAKYGPYTQANVLLAFGAVVDFLAGAMQRAPRWVSDHGVEWLWRLILEPQRLARRYLVDDPPSLMQLRRNSFVHADGQPEAAHREPRSLTPAAHGTRPALRGSMDGSFIPPGEYTDVVVYVVTYNSAEALGELVAGLRLEAKTIRLRVVVADNDSKDGTLKALEAYPDVYALPTGGNLGYAGGINAAMRVPGGSDAVLVLNPDIALEAGSVTALYRRLIGSDAGIVVPQLLEEDGSTYASLRREPTILRAVGDALFGSRFTSRPSWLAEMDYEAESYRNPHRVEWATGAALLVRSDLADKLGDWDEQFFLYSEEVDYFRRAREAGESIWYEPRARMTHRRGGSGASAQLNALMAVNRIRYVRKYRSNRYAAVFRAAVVLAETMRFYKRTRLGVLRTVLSEQSWNSLPGPTAADSIVQMREQFPSGAVIIPAHNEETVIGRTLDRLVPALSSGNVEVIVACNGCTDGTVEVAKSYDGVRVLQLEHASKTTALNAADAAATLWPRLYLDADIEISIPALRIVLDRLNHSRILAARPAFRYDSDGASWPVRAFYRARRRIPSTSQALWGAGVYGLTEAGHARFGNFPPVTADDLLVDRLFAPSEKAVVHTPPVTVRTPLSVSSLLAILRRNYRGQAELGVREQHVGPVLSRSGGNSTRFTVRELVRSIRGPVSAFDATVYAALVTAARFRRSRPDAQVDAMCPAPGWERDASSRVS
jgi:exopolysaccharide biosynthesis WecB/TagA/CpsF family protein